MMKKVILCILILVFTSACTVEYSIELSSDSILETMNVIEYDHSKWDTTLNGSSVDELIQSAKKQYIEAFYHQSGNPYDSSDQVNGIEYYTMQEISNHNRKGIRYTYQYALDEYKNSNFLNQCFDLVNVQMSGIYFTFSTSRTFRCFEYYKQVDQFDIRLQTKHKVVSHNATKVDGNTYIWEMTAQNVDMPIQFQVNMKELVEEGNHSSDMLIFAFILIFLIIVGFFGYRMVVTLQHKNNKI